MRERTCIRMNDKDVQVFDVVGELHLDFILKGGFHIQI